MQFKENKTRGRRSKILKDKSSSWKRRYDILDSSSQHALVPDVLQIITEQADPCVDIGPIDCLSSSPKLIPDPFTKDGRESVDCTQWCWDTCHDSLEYCFHDFPAMVLNEAKIDLGDIKSYVVRLLFAVPNTNNVIVLFKDSTEKEYRISQRNKDFSTNNIQGICAELDISGYEMIFYQFRVVLKEANPRLGRNLMSVLTYFHPTYNWILDTQFDDEPIMTAYFKDFKFVEMYS